MFCLGKMITCESRNSKSIFLPSKSLKLYLKQAFLKYQIPAPKSFRREATSRFPFFHLHFFIMGKGQHDRGIQSAEIQEITFTMGPYRLVTAHKFSHFRPLKKWGRFPKRKRWNDRLPSQADFQGRNCWKKFRGWFSVGAEITPLKKGADFEGHSHGAQAFPAVWKWRVFGW